MKGYIARHNAKAPLSLAAEVLPGSSLVLFGARKIVESAAVRTVRATDGYEENEDDVTYRVHIHSLCVPIS